MPADKYEGLNACLCLLTKNVNNFAELNIRSTNHMNHRSNTEYCESTSGLMLSLPAPRLPVQNSVSRSFCVMLKRLQMGSRQLAATDWRRLTNQSAASSWIAPSRLGPVGPFCLRNVVACFHLCKDKWDLVPFSHCKCGAIAQTGDNVASECNMHCALQRARDRTVLDEKINNCGVVHC